MSEPDATALLETGKPIVLKCQSTLHNPNYLYVDGVTSAGGVQLSPATTGLYTGTHWMPEKRQDGAYRLRCLSKTVDEKSTYLGARSDGWAVLFPADDTSDRIYWKIESVQEKGEVTLKCMHTADNKVDAYLDGLTDQGYIKLSSATDTQHSGTHWKLGVTEFAPAYAHLILHRYYPDLNIHCFPIHGNYRQVEFDTLRHIWEHADLKVHSGYYSGNDLACGFKKAVSDWFFSHDQNWPHPVLCGVMWGILGEGETQAINFSIDAFGELVLFNPATGEKIPTSLWKPQLCFY